MPIAMAYVPPGRRAPGTMVEVGIRGARVAAEVVALPFYQARRLSRGPAQRSRSDRAWRCPTTCATREDHEWVRVEGDEGVVGITAYAADELGDVVFVELPAVGAGARAGEPFGVIESVKTASDLYAPVAGEVVAVNEALAGAARAGQQRPLRRGLDDPVRLDRPGGGRRPARTPHAYRAPDRRLALQTDGLRSAHRRRPRADARARSASTRSTRCSRTSRPRSAPTGLDLPAGRARAGRSRGGSRRWPARNRVGLASFLGAGVYRHHMPRDGGPDPLARRVQHRLHAVPAGDQPGHAPDDLRVPVAASPS